MLEENVFFTCFVSRNKKKMDGVGLGTPRRKLIVLDIPLEKNCEPLVPA